MKEVFLGIDPGQSGGIAYIDEKGKLLQAVKMGETESDTASLLIFPGIWRAMIERVHPMPASLVKDGQVRRQGISSTFKFAQSYGFLRGLLMGMKIPFDDVPPITWQRYMHCLTHGNKNVSKAKAQQLFPGVKITHATADAILIAEYGRLLFLGLLPPPIKVVRMNKTDPDQIRVRLPSQEQVEDF